MAAIYSGIHLKLKSPHTPWEDKLKLARFGWVSTQCLLPNKEQVLLDWCTHALIGWYSQKVEFSHHVLEGLWCYLDDLLHSKKLHSLLKQGKTVSLRLNMAQLLLERLQEFAHSGSKSPVLLSTLLSVCRGLLSSPALSSVFFTKYELMVDLLANICSLACHKLSQQPILTDSQVTESVQCQDEAMIKGLQRMPVCDLDGSQSESTNDNPPYRQVSDADKSCPHPKENVRSANLFDVLLQVLSCYLSVQRQQANPNRVFTMVTNQLFQVLVLLRHLLTSGDFAPYHTDLCLNQQLCRDIRIKIDSILQLALFPSEHLDSYKDELLPSKEDSGKRGLGRFKGLWNPVTAIFSKLSAQGYCEPPLRYTVTSSTLPLLFKTFLESYVKGRGDGEEAHGMLCFSLLTRLVPALNIGLDGHSPSPAKADQAASESSGQKSFPAPSCSPESWSLALLAVESLLNQVLAADVYNVAADRIRHREVQLTFYRAIAQMLLNHAQPSIPAWYRCLKVLLSLNHLILEPDLDQLLSCAWVNSECMEPRVQRARQHLVCSLLQTYTKLRQLPRFFSELLSVICQPALDHLRPPLLSEGVSSSLRTCLLDTPPSQGVEICSLALECIQSNIIPDLVKEETVAENMEIDEETDDKGQNKEIKTDQKRDDASLKLFSLSQLLHVVLFSLKTLDNASPLPVVRQSQCRMGEMQQVVGELLHLLSSQQKVVNSKRNVVQRTPKKGKKNSDYKGPEKISESKVGAQWEQRTQEATLLLRYTWVEVDTLFQIHCSKYTPLDLATSETEGHARFLSNIESLISGETFPACLRSPQSPMSCLLLRLLTLQQMKKVLLHTTLLSDPGTAALLNRATQFILSKSDLKMDPDEEQVWDMQIGSVNTSSYSVAHWYLIASNLPLIAPHLREEGVGSVADTLVSSLLSRDIHTGKACPPGCLTTFLISSQLLQSPILPELPSLFSAMVSSLVQRIVTVLKAAHVPKICPTLLKCQEEGIGADSLGKDSRQALTKVIETETIVQDIMSSSETGEMAVMMTDAQKNELLNLLEILSHLNPDGMNSEDLSSVFLLLLFTLTCASRQSDQMAAEPPESGNDADFLVKLIRILTCLAEGRNFQSVLKLIHGGTLLQVVMSSLFLQSKSGRFRATSSSDWLDLIRAVREFIRCLVQLIIIRNSSVRLNLDQFASFLSGQETVSTLIVAHDTAAIFGKADRGASILSVHLLLASLMSFSQAMATSLGKSKLLDQTLAQMLSRMTASLGPAVESVLKPWNGCQSVSQPANVLGQAFVVEVVTVMLHCELSSLSVQEDNTQNDVMLGHMSLYQGFCQQILKEISSAQRPLDFLVSSLHFLSAFYKALKTRVGKRKEEEEEGETIKAGKELDELYMQILQKVHKLLTASWLSPSDLWELEPAVQDLLCHLVDKCTTGQFNLLLLMIRDGLKTSQLRTGNYREVLSAVITMKLLSNCQLPEPCSKALWLFVPQIISAMVILIRSSSQDTSLTLPFTIPAVTSVTALLRQGEGLITNSHHVILVLGALHSVPLDHLTPHVYKSAFLAVHEGLFAIIKCHPEVMLSAAPSFLNVFHRLVASIMQEGRQRGETDTGADRDVYLECSRLVERMYTHIAATAEKFTTLSTFMVAQYITELQKVTLRPDIKLHLTEGIYRILDLCMEHDIRFLIAGLQMGAKEVFNELYGSYTHYHKAQRQGEDKYTV